MPNCDRTFILELTKLHVLEKNSKLKSFRSYKNLEQKQISVKRNGTYTILYIAKTLILQGSYSLRGKFSRALISKEAIQGNEACI